ncbi:MAG: YbhB/YbcL family Raf kinase inhibitor-like protein [Candidatus Woesearchaeota archaeon]
MKKTVMLAFFLFSIAIIGCSSDPAANLPAEDEVPVASQEVETMTSLTLTSPAFQDNGDIPAKYTCQGDDINPELVIGGIPAETKTLALIMDDPDAPVGVWVHWVEYNIAPTASIPEAAGKVGDQGLNSWKKTGYAGPCPPSGKHRYIFKIYALDTELTIKNPDKTAVEAAMEGHVLAQVKLTGLYEKI